jgi:hypothetical protein
MKVARIFASLLLLAATASISSAAGVVSINWNTCNGGPTDKTPMPALAAQKMVISVIGQDQPHKAYDVRILLGQPGGLKDAWRFDAAGCEGPTLYAINVVDSKACATAFMQAATGLQIKKFDYDPIGLKAQGLLANAYSDINSVNPATRYLLASFQFDMSFAVAGAGDPPNSCGGLDAPLCVALTNTSWLTLDGQEIQWDKSGTPYLTANDALNAQHCPAPVPAMPKTWGSLKSQYRN